MMISLLLAVGVLGGLAGAAAADDATPAAIDAPAGNASGADANAAVDTPTAAATETPTETAVPADSPAATDAPATDVPTDTPTAEATDSPTATPAPEPPALTATSALDPVCALAKGQPDAVASGGFADYECSYELALAGDRLAPSWISIDWSVSAKIDGGWTVQLRSATPNAEWSPAGASMAALQRTAARFPDASTDLQDGFHAVATWRFEVRLTRTACDLAPAALTLTPAAAASLPSHDDAAVANHSARTDADPLFSLKPALAPIPAPSIALTGSLDFGTIGLTASGPKTTPKPKVLTLTVTGLDQACGVWNLTMVATTIDAATGQATARPTLNLVAIDGRALDGGVPLDGAAPVLTVQAGPDAAATATHHLSIALVLPDQPALAAYQTSLRVSLDAAAGSNGAVSADS